jgi:hypothetical protein
MAESSGSQPANQASDDPTSMIMESRGRFDMVAGAQGKVGKESLPRAPTGCGSNLRPDVRISRVNAKFCAGSGTDSSPSPVSAAGIANRRAHGEKACRFARSAVPAQRDHAAKRHRAKAGRRPALAWLGPLARGVHWRSVNVMRDT